MFVIVIFLAVETIGQKDIFCQTKMDSVFNDWKLKMSCSAWLNCQSNVGERLDHFNAKSKMVKGMGRGAASIINI